MKRLLPHLVYLVLIASLGIFFWQRLRSENQLIVMLNQPTDEAHIAAKQRIQQMEKDISRLVKKYRSPRFFEFEQRTQFADSLIGASFSDPAERDSLPLRLWVLTDRNPEFASVFQTILPPKSQSVFSPHYHEMLLQNDSLRRQLALWTFLKYCAEHFGGESCGFDTWQPVVSFTTLCPRVGEPFEMDILLSKYSTRTEVTHISVNGQLLHLKEGLAHFKRTFSKPGVYPLKVKADYQYWENDSLSVVEKTFYLHVSR